MCLLYRCDQLNLVGGRNHNGVRLLGNDRIENGNLQRNVPFRRTLIDELGADGLRRSFGAMVHGDIETVRGQSGNKRNRDFVLSGFFGSKQRGGGSGCCAHYFYE